MLDLKREALESLSIGVGGTRAAAIWDVIARAFALHSEPVIHPYSDYAGQAPGEDPFDAVDPALTIGRPLGYDVAAAPVISPWIILKLLCIIYRLAYLQSLLMML